MADDIPVAPNGRPAEDGASVEARLLDALRASGVGTWDWDLATDRVTWSDAHDAMFGFEPGTAPTTIAGLVKRIHPDDLERQRQALERCRSEGTAAEEEFRIVLPDGRVRWIRGVGRVVRDASGRPARVVGTSIDITAQVEARGTSTSGESEIARTAHAVRDVLETLPDATAVYDREWRWIYLNPTAAAVLRLTGRDPAKLLGRVVWEEYPEVIPSRFHSESLRAVAENRVLQVEDFLPIVGRWFETRVVPTAEGVVTYSRDITTRKNAEWEREQALALERAARRAAQLATSRMEQLQRATAALSMARTSDEIADALVAQSRAALGAEGAALLLAAGAQEPFEPATVRESEFPAGSAGGRSVSLAAIVPVDATLAQGDVFGVRALDQWLALDPERAAQISASGYQSVACVPLALPDRVAGVLALGFDAAREFADDERFLLGALARQGASALERARLFESERAARADAEKANRVKSEFMAIMSHELRTPLSAIIGYAELLADGITGPVSEEQHAQLIRIGASARHLLALIEDILDFSRLDAGGDEARIEAVPVAELTRETAALIEPVASTHGLRLTVDIGPTPSNVASDARRIRQILLNLLSNAVRYTSAGEVSLALRADDRYLRWTVRDTGIGIAAADLERIFTPFYQVDSSFTRKVGGTGLGLSVSRRLARLLGGDLTVESEIGKGSAFTLTLPIGTSGQ